MKLSALMTVNAVIAGLFGIAFVVVPVRLLAIYGITADAQLALIGQLFGAALLGYALLTWTARNAAASDARGAIVLALFVSEGIGFVVGLIAQLRNVVNQVGWSTVVIYLLLALGFGYFQFKKPASE
jgi:hypothetical protein